MNPRPNKSKIRKPRRRTDTERSVKGARGDTSEPERLQKVLARAGLGSRRSLEALIEAGEVMVDGRRAELGDKVGPRARITVRGRKVSAKRLQAPPTRVIGLHKPLGVVSTRFDPEGRETIVKLLPRLRNGRWAAVGRLDINTTGLLLFSTDGELVHRLMHPSSGIEREYAVRVYGELTADAMRALREGVSLEDGMAALTSIQEAGGEGANRWYHAVITEGRYREVRRMFAEVGVQVSRLMRIRYGPVRLPGRVRAGKHFELRPKEIQALYSAVGLKAPANIGAPTPRKR